METLSQDQVPKNEFLDQSRKLETVLDKNKIEIDSTQIDEQYKNVLSQLENTIKSNNFLSSEEKSRLFDQAEVMIDFQLSNLNFQLLELNIQKDRELKIVYFRKIVIYLNELVRTLSSNLESASDRDVSSALKKTITDDEFDEVYASQINVFFKKPENQKIWFLERAIKLGWKITEKIGPINYIEVNKSENLRNIVTNRVTKSTQKGEKFQIVGDLPNQGKYEYKRVVDEQGRIFKICVNDRDNVTIKEFSTGDKSAQLDNEQPIDISRSQKSGETIVGEKENPIPEKREIVTEYQESDTNSQEKQKINEQLKLLLKLENEDSSFIATQITKYSKDFIDLGRTNRIDNIANKLIDVVSNILIKRQAQGSVPIFEKVYSCLSEKVGLSYANLLKDTVLKKIGKTESTLSEYLRKKYFEDVKQNYKGTVIWFDQVRQITKIFQMIRGKYVLIDSFDARGGSREAKSKNEDSGLLSRTKTPDGVFKAESIAYHTTERYKEAWIAGSSNLKFENGIVYHQFPNTSEWLPATGDDATYLIKGRKIRWDDIRLQTQVVGGASKLKEKIQKRNIETSNLAIAFKQWKENFPNDLVQFTNSDFDNMISSGYGKYLNRNPFGDNKAVNVGNTGTFLHQKVIDLGLINIPLDQKYARSGGAIFVASHGCISTFDHNHDRMLGYMAPGAKIVISSNEEDEHSYLAKIGLNIKDNRDNFASREVQLKDYLV